MIFKTALIGSIAVAATLAVGASTRAVLCANRSVGENPGLLFCDGDIDHLLQRSAEGDAARALKPWQRDAFVAALKRHTDPAALDGLLQQVAGSGNREATRLLLATGADINGVPPPFHGSGTALGAAAENGDLQMMQLMLDAGAKIDGPDPSRKEPPLYAAARGGQVAAVRFLLDRGADLNGGVSPFELAVSRTDPMGMVRFGRRSTPIYETLRVQHWQNREIAREGREAAVLLVENGATIIGGDGVEAATDQSYGDDMKGSDRWKAISILLALAARNGRWNDMMARLNEQTGPLWISDRMPRRPNPNAVLRPYLDAVSKCGANAVRAEKDYFVFCPDRRDARLGSTTAQLFQPAAH